MDDIVRWKHDNTDKSYVKYYRNYKSTDFYRDRDEYIELYWYPNVGKYGALKQFWIDSGISKKTIKDTIDSRCVYYDKRDPKKMWSKLPIPE
ncbi:MAG: hypothetical protein GY870_22665 [archaeon]|nr:hypothetical protein [archaeon]